MEEHHGYRGQFIYISLTFHYQLNIKIKKHDGNVCCVAAVVKDSVVLALECRSMLYVCVKGVMDVVVYVCIVAREALGARVWGV